MEKLYELIERFQSLKNKTGTNKSSSYELNLYFSPWDDKVSINWGCYEIGDYPRHYETNATRDTLLAHMESEISKMEQVVAATQR